MAAVHARDPIRFDRSNRPRRRFWLVFGLGLGLVFGFGASAGVIAVDAADVSEASRPPAEKRSPNVDESQPLASPEAIYERVYEAYQGLETVRLHIAIEQRIAETGTPSTITGMLYASKAAGVVRFEIASPDVLEDQVIVVSAEDAMVRTYVPVTEQVIERPLSEVAYDQMNPDQWQSIDDLLTLPSMDDFQFQLVQVPHAVADDGRYNEYSDETGQADRRYALDVTSKEHPELGVQRIWVDPDIWLPTELRALDKNGIGLYHIYLDNIERNVNLSRENLVRLP